MNLNDHIVALKAVPRWRLYLYGAIMVFVAVYLGWTVWGSRPQKPGDGFVPLKPAVKEPKVQGPQVGIKIVPADAVRKKYPRATKKDSEEWIDTAKVPEAPNGGTITTRIDTVTGETTNDFQADPPPLFAFERNNAVGIGYEIGTQGSKVPIYYRRDVLRVKDLHLVGEVGAKIALDPKEKSEVHATGLLEFRF